MTRGAIPRLVLKRVPFCRHRDWRASGTDAAGPLVARGPDGTLLPIGYDHVGDGVPFGILATLGGCQCLAVR